MKEEVKKLHATYQINIQGLANKRYEFEFGGGQDFFESFEQDIIEKGNFKAKVSLDKSDTMMRLNIDITGSVTLVCDRSLKEFEEVLGLSELYVYKFGDRFEVVSENMEIIPTETVEINLANNLFEYICLAVPMKKLHPDYRDDDGGLIYSDNFEEKNSSKEEIDPRWAALKNLKKDL
ncbi:MAG: hypothetical protein ACI97P_002415 [Arcticibacterium sp.]